MNHAIYSPEAQLQVALRTATKLLPLVAGSRKAEKCGLKSVAVSRAVHLLETKFRAALRTATRLQHFVARQRKAEKCKLKSVQRNSHKSNKLW
ncbi:hypothetical protein [Pilibacter termitis]|uniref:hypothetical protein n=1 Tax=Pilibacter termitis TaxID=263852 RepID=UPI001185AAA4|nr:hypothetical protein [Pilibacter termitis]